MHERCAQGYFKDGLGSKQKSDGDCPIQPGVAAGELIIPLPLPHLSLQAVQVAPFEGLLAAAVVAPELIVQAETFFKVIPCFGEEKRAWSHWEGGGGCFLPALLQLTEKEASYCLSSSCGCQNRTKSWLKSCS